MGHYWCRVVLSRLRAVEVFFFISAVTVVSQKRADVTKVTESGHHEDRLTYQVAFADHGISCHFAD